MRNGKMHEVNHNAANVDALLCAIDSFFFGEEDETKFLAKVDAARILLHMAIGLVKEMREDIDTLDKDDEAGDIFQDRKIRIVCSV